MKNLGRYPASKEFSFLSYFNGSELGWVGVRQVHFLGRGAQRRGACPRSSGQHLAHSGCFVDEE